LDKLNTLFSREKEMFGFISYPQHLENVWFIGHTEKIR
jgi:hypothetical protein